jgi:putative FmdB family regulatory protein
MPTYEYRCTRCKHQFEAVHRVGETVERCERCGARVRRVFSAPALIFKGSGWYITDHRKTPAPSEGDGGAPKSAAKPASESKPGSESKSDSGGAGASKSSDAKKGKKAS